MKKLSAVTAAALVAGAIAVVPTASAATTSAATVFSAPEEFATADQDVETQDGDESAPAITFYASAVGDMFKCGGSFGKLWCKK